MQEPTLEEVLLEVLDSRLAQVHTALPGKVLKYDAAKQTADIQIQVKDVEPSEDGPVSRSYPVLPNVPVAWPRAGGFYLHLPMGVGDFVYVVFSESSIDQWRAKGTETAPGDVRRHSLTGAVALPCLYPRAGALDTPDSDVAVLGKEGGTTDFVALAAKVDDFIARLDTVIRTAWIVSPADGGAALKAAYAAEFVLPPSSVASEDVKVT